MKIGVVAYQGSFEEHALSVKRVFDKIGKGEVIPVKKPKDLDVDGIIIPGGESTTIGQVALRLGLLDPLKEKINQGIPVLGTCAGAIMLSKEVTDAKVGKKGQPLIGVMDASVIRNYYGRQRESFEAIVDLEEIEGGKEKFVFIRAPAISKVWGKAKALATLNDVIVMAQEDQILTTTFHPELSGTTSIHEYFLRMIKR
ncbi:Pyridoxal 5'-phosphate synthase subunit PdxT [Metallosphaera sp. J1]|uniref:pyridoxal 5'-phosphate synthase glutaminase subunit PdxT n=1 Tax=Metallosphaera TaxID=41980 RepID=UPI001EDCEC7A|nr:pyridoxal 5'-phosphate synthase glutaminase subunit PdxT [Metallosphaera javensis (ex Hofmann et al. 2022)]MCG3108696.1 Pyridoxal 5'-phosphate synthase subunit PdxT [Metallosphaera javensis (ex Hofmann et al. 2022)]BCS91616.1 MAG: pyridoxal 5'-phosphate synthase glutaminase subunit PdxT [Metallosphaera javensis (ex Sakai et al. 2022)]